MDPRLIITSLHVVGFIRKLIFPLMILVVIVGFFYIANGDGFKEIKKTFENYSTKAADYLSGIKEVVKF
jgi:hypothetical protein